MEVVLRITNKLTKILCVDDDKMMRRVVKRFLPSEIYEVTNARNGLEALSLLGAGKYDLVLLDIGMPDISGIEVLKRIRDDKRLKNLPVIMISGMDSKDYIIRCMEFRADDFVLKPFDANVLIHSITKVMHRNDKKPKNGFFTASIVSTGARAHFSMAVAMTSIIPLLLFTSILASPVRKFDLGDPVTVAVCGFAVFLMILGYSLLMKYPRNIMKLRHYLELLSKGDTHEQIKLSKDEDDLKVIQLCLMDVIKQTEARIKTIEKQSQAIIEAEQQKVMVESLGTACHYMGQPATVLSMCIAMIEQKDKSGVMKDVLESAREAMSEMTAVIAKLQSATFYRTEQYLDKRPDGSEDKIIKIDAA